MNPYASINPARQDACPNCGKPVTLLAPMRCDRADATEVAGGPSAATKLVVVLAILSSAVTIAVYRLMLYSTVSFLFKRIAKIRLPAAQNWVLWELMASASIVLVLFAILGNILFEAQPAVKPSPAMTRPAFITICIVIYVTFSLAESAFAAIQLRLYCRAHFAEDANGRRSLLMSLFLGFFLTNFVCLVVALAAAFAGSGT
jgi:hypothetical protein